MAVQNPVFMRPTAPSAPGSAGRRADRRSALRPWRAARVRLPARPRQPAARFPPLPTAPPGRNPEDRAAPAHMSCRTCCASRARRATAGNTVATARSNRTGQHRASTSAPGSSTICHLALPMIPGTGPLLLLGENTSGARGLAPRIRPHRPAQSGMLSCFFHGICRFLLRNEAKARLTRIRVLCGWITSSMKPRSAATKGLAKRSS
jgi:hypothetical protein